MTVELGAKHMELNTSAIGNALGNNLGNLKGIGREHVGTWRARKENQK
jgi:hypothetical protein